jgi:DNA-binding Lrp family transcriptional regulator
MEKYINEYLELKQRLRRLTEGRYEELRKHRCDGIIQAYGIIANFNLQTQGDDLYSIVLKGVDIYRDALEVIEDFFANDMKPIDASDELKKYHKNMDISYFYDMLYWGNDKNIMKEKPEIKYESVEGIVNLLDMLGYKTSAGITRLLKGSELLKHKPYKELTKEQALEIVCTVTPPKTKMALFNRVIDQLKA